MSNKKFPLISVVMLNYNGLKYLKRTIHSILKLDYPNYEFIIVDNGSNDESIKFIKKFKKIRLIKSPRLREKNFACNYAIKKARGKYILLLDNDSLIMERELLNSLLIKYNQNKKTGLIGLSFVDEGEDKIISYGLYFSKYFTKELRKLSLCEVKSLDGNFIGYPDGKGFFIKKSIWLTLGGYDENLIFGGDDNDVGIKSWLFGYKNYLYSRTIQLHLGKFERKDTVKYSLKIKEIFWAVLVTIIKDFKLKNVLIILPIYSFFMFIKLIKQSIFRFDLRPFLAFFQGYYLFLKSFPYALKQRKIIQSKRKIKEDIFLKIKPPKFD